ncbi:cryptochrome [Aureobasidium pullulans]|uniref:Cryptochrome DASH n=1 Tax=Aureobasidium pullulans TaxID=5580 RepID=A0A4S9KH76_AURPU|nr:cryptochrome [Aureobasidium pullulans]
MTSIPRLKMSPKARVLIYVLRRDLRLADNPVFHEVSRLFQQSQHPFTHFLPVYTFPANQVEVSGFISDSSKKSPYPEARAPVSGFWRCGKLRAKFLAESVWDLKKDLERVGSDLQVRVGTVHDAVRSILDSYKEHNEVDIAGVWMTNEEGVEEKREEKDVRKLCKQFDAEFKLWVDEKYFVDDRDVPFKNPGELNDVFTAYRKTVEPLRSAPRKTLPAPSTLPPLPSHIPAQAEPFEIPDSLEGVMSALTKPLGDNYGLPDVAKWPKGAESAHPYIGGSKSGHERIDHLIESGSMTAYKDTRNGLLGQDFSTKLSAWLALGCTTARQIHWKLIDFEDGKTDLGKSTPGYGKGENKGTAAVRFELLWRDYMRLCTRKFGPRLFHVEGFRNDQNANWKYISSPFSDSTSKKNKGGANDDATAAAVLRFVTGRTGTGLIDASQRELFLTGYTSNRARQNVASYLSKHMGVDWRIGAEWYECNLIDYDLSSNWGNWQYVAGVGNDPRGESRVFNPIKQALDYDSQGEYIRTWVEELRDVDVSQDSSNLMGVFQAWKLPEDEKKKLGIQSVEWVQKPLVKIDFSLNRRGGGSKRGRGNGRGGRGGGRGGRGDKRNS